MGIYVLSYEHVCSMLMKLSHSETKVELMPKYVQIMSGGVAGKQQQLGTNLINHIIILTSNRNI